MRIWEGEVSDAQGRSRESREEVVGWSLRKSCENAQVQVRGARRRSTAEPSKASSTSWPQSLWREQQVRARYVETVALGEEGGLSQR